MIMFRTLFRHFITSSGDAYKTFIYGDSCSKGSGTRLLKDCMIENLQRNAQSIVLGKDCLIRGHLLVWKHGGKIEIGDSTFVGVRSEIWSMANVSIGNRVLIAHDVNINDANAHSKLPEERYRHYRYMLEQGHPAEATILGNVPSAPIIIEDDVWISFGCKILKGVRIGARSIIAAGTVVTENVPPDSLCMFNQQLEIRPLNYR